MIDKDTITFLKNLGRNNNRQWFHEHRPEYEVAKRNILDLTLYLISEIEKFDVSVSHTDPEDCLFRINRDTRFSHDKTPYKTNFGAFIKQGGKRTAGAGYYMHVSPGEHLLAGGIYMPPANALLAIRKSIARDSKPLKKIIATPEFIREFGGLSGETLKTAPRGFPKDHPDIELLRYKHYMVVEELKEQEVLAPDFPKKCVKVFRAMYPLNAYINGLV